MQNLKLSVAFAALTLAAATQAADINLNSIFDVARGVAKSTQLATMTDADEVAAGKEIAASTLGAYPVERNEKLQRYINSVGTWVAMQSERPNLPWRFAVVKSPQVNAFAVPGGTVLVTSGMFSMLNNEAELACVLGHEIGHIVRRHHISLMQSETLTQTATKVAGDNVRGGGLQGEAKKLALSEGGQIFSRSLDRGSERDADSDGVLLAARAGYDAAACLSFMERLASTKTQANALESLYKTHPQAADRVGDISKALERLQGAPAGTGARPQLAVNDSKKK